MGFQVKTAQKEITDNKRKKQRLKKKIFGALKQNNSKKKYCEDDLDGDQLF